MQGTFSILSILSTFILGTYVVPSFETSFEGVVSTEEQSIDNQMLGWTIFVKAENEILAKSYLDSVGHYHLSFYPNQHKVFDFYISNGKTDTTFLKSYTSFGSDYTAWNIKLPLEPEKKRRSNHLSEMPKYGPGVSDHLFAK